jgi:integrase
MVSDQARRNSSRQSTRQLRGLQAAGDSGRQLSSQLRNVLCLLDGDLPVGRWFRLSVAAQGRQSAYQGVDVRTGSSAAAGSKRRRRTCEGTALRSSQPAAQLKHLAREQREVDPKTVQGMLRHSDIRTTMNLYMQDDPDEKQAAQGAFL